MRIKKGDTIIVLSGKERGTKAKVMTVLPKTLQVLVDGVGMRQKRERPRKEGAKGQTVSAPSPIPASRVALFCTSCNKGVRVGMDVSGKKNVRICRSCKNNI